MIGTAPEGRARRFGDDVNTDYIISSTRKRESLDPLVLRRYLFESVDPGFAATIQPGDIIVAGSNFGCGSAMEVAVTAILGAQIPAVLARSFSRTYYRNAINNGLLPIVCDTGSIREGDRLSIRRQPTLCVRNEASGKMLATEALPKIMLDILEAGGLVPYMRQCGEFIL